MADFVRGDSPYPRNDALCVLPTGTESQYESFQAIFTEIMYAQYGDVVTPPTSAYEIMCSNRGITLKSRRDGQPPPQENPVIFFKPEGITHYKALVNGVVLDPYGEFQARGTQGFCQMFAFLLATRNISELSHVDQSKKIDVVNFNKLAKNSQVCLTKFSELIREDRDARDSFKRSFDDIMDNPSKRKKYGIIPDTTVEKYFGDFTIINNDINAVKCYIYDQPLVGWRKGLPKQELWDSFMARGGKKRKPKTARRTIKKRRRLKN